MQAELKKKWIEALRSDKYKQGRGRLRTCWGEFCCLGVLCDVINPNEWEDINNGNGKILWVYDRHLISLPPTCAKGMSGQIEQDLMEMNDNGKTFEEIAEFIEKFVPEDK